MSWGHSPPRMSVAARKVRNHRRETRKLALGLLSLLPLPIPTSFRHDFNHDPRLARGFAICNTEQDRCQEESLVEGKENNKE